MRGCQAASIETLAPEAHFLIRRAQLFCNLLVIGSRCAPADIPVRTPKLRALPYRFRRVSKPLHLLFLETLPCESHISSQPRGRTGMVTADRLSTLSREAYPARLATSRLAIPWPVLGILLSRSGRPARQAKYGKGWAIYAFPGGCRRPSLKQLTTVRPQPVAGDNTHEAHPQQRGHPICPRRWRRVGGSRGRGGGLRRVEFARRARA